MFPTVVQQLTTKLQVIYFYCLMTIAIAVQVYSISYNTNTNNLFPPIPSNTVMFIYDKYDNKYYNTISCSCLLQKIKDLFTMSLWIRISCSHFLLGLL